MRLLLACLKGLSAAQSDVCERLFLICNTSVVVCTVLSTRPVAPCSRCVPAQDLSTACQSSTTSSKWIQAWADTLLLNNKSETVSQQTATACKLMHTSSDKPTNKT